MLTPGYFNVLTWTYPVGNTPALCLTQNLPREKDADILLLGCGDARSILFTNHVDGVRRRMDITCCNHDRSVLARNILLFTLILDDVKGQRNDEAWAIYYHRSINQECYARIHEQAKKLCSVADSLETWRSSEYGKLLKFCDSGSLSRIRDVWSFYCDEARTEANLRVSIKRGLTRRNKAGVVLTGLRSTAPTAGAGLEDTVHMQKQFWDHGTTDTTPRTESQGMIRGNPTFASPDAGVTGHYGLGPLLGFHLCTAYVPMMAGSPLSQSPAKKSAKGDAMVTAARTEFYAWVDSFRKNIAASTSNLTLRFFAGDAIAFSHVLQCRRTGGNQPGWYRTRNDMDPIVLDDEDYSPSGAAPLAFNVIDTSNLSDHVGALNLLVATSPLLATTDVSASLYTESLVKQGKSLKELVDMLVCGDLTTISFLVGLLPAEYWTNTSPMSSGDELMLDSVSRVGKLDVESGQAFARITWKRPLESLDDGSTFAMQALRADEASLANVLHQVYLKMFAHEDVSALFANVSAGNMRKVVSLPTYQRAGFTAFLRLVKTRVRGVDWADTMMGLLDRIVNDQSLLVGSNALQELYLYLHVHGLLTVDIFKVSYNLNAASTGPRRGLADWKDMPPVVSVTLRVPRAKLRAFTGSDPLDVGTPPVQCSVKTTQWDNTFAAVQIGFGELTTSGSRYTNDFRVRVAGDLSSWNGRSDLFMSFLAPAWMLLQDQHRARVELNVQSLPSTIATFRNRLGAMLNVFGTRLADPEHVYVTKNLPNHEGTMAVAGFTGNDIMDAEAMKAGIRTSITMAFDNPKTAKLTSLTCRLDINSEDLASALSGGCVVKTTPTSPSTFDVQVGKQILKGAFPIPVDVSSCKTRIARKSLFIELVVPVVSNPSHIDPASMLYPAFLADGGVPVAWNMTHINLQKMPLLDTSQKNHMQWCSTHTGLMLSDRDRHLRDDRTLSRNPAELARMDFKDSLFSMFMHATGLQGHFARVFGLNNKTDGAVHVLVFVSGVRLDLSSRTVLLDAAILPLRTELVPQLGAQLAALIDGKLMAIHVDGEEMRVWKGVLPSMTERCRSWEHKAKCEYRAKRKVPLSFENGERVLCSCGEGVFDEGFKIDAPGWDVLMKYAVRGAISPAFYSPLVDNMYDVLGNMPAGSVGGTAAAGGGGEEERKGAKAACDVCGKERAKSGAVKMKACSRCGRGSYCSRECQKADWKVHKKGCKAGKN